MPQSIPSRVKRIISGSINILIDAAEGVSPQTIMKESIKEVDAVIAQIRHEAGKMVVEKTRLKRQISELAQRHETLEEQIKIAIKEDREDLAEAGVAKQINIEEQLPLLKLSLSETDEKIVEYEGYIKALLAKKRDMEDELAMLKTKADSPINDTKESIDAAQQAFARVMGIDFVRIDTHEQSKLNELEELSREKKINERIKALKEKLDDWFWLQL